MASPHNVQRTGQPGWTLMTAIHDALRRDMDELLDITGSRSAARARWVAFRDQLDLHLAAEDAAMWRPARGRLAGDPYGQALLDAMEDEHRLIGPLRAMTDDAFTMGADHVRLRQLLTTLRTRVTSHLTHEEAVALPLIATVMSPAEFGRITRAIGGGYCVRRAARTVSWALASAADDVRAQALGQLPGPARLFYRTVWLPRQHPALLAAVNTRSARSRTAWGTGSPSGNGRPAMPVYATAPAASADWASRGACLDSDPDLFFPVGSSGPALRQIAQAKAICAHCPVRLDCLSYALRTGQPAGVWGGTSEEERREIRSATIAARTSQRREHR